MTKEELVLFIKGKLKSYETEPGCITCGYVPMTTLVNNRVLDSYSIGMRDAYNEILLMSEYCPSGSKL